MRSARRLVLIGLLVGLPAAVAGPSGSLPRDAYLTLARLLLPRL
jgi:hypothetical protein